MRQRIFFLLLAIVAGTSMVYAQSGIGVFSVSATQQVTFSPGNLQFNAAQGTHQCADGSTNQGTWRFAEHQWDIVGMGYGLTNTNDPYDCYIGGTVLNGDNRQINSTYNGWIDLFGWGTSGWNSGANAYQPWSTSQTNTDYAPGNNLSNNLTGNYANADWGVYNQIGEDDPGTWRTLTKDEWTYLFKTRTNASSKYGAAKVNGMTGVVILPDVFTLPAGCGFTAGMTSASDWYDWSYVATTNIYTTAQWQLMESAGAVFLPASGNRYGASVVRTGTYGYYWSSTQYSQLSAYYLYFYSGGLSPQYSYSRGYGRAVRLVRSFSGLDNTPETYIVTFVNYDGTELQSGEMKAGTMPEYNSETPTKPADAQYIYSFAGWTPELTAVTGDATYMAVYTSVPTGGGATGGIGVFSVSATQQVTFSPGNLQFNAVLGTHQCADGTTQQGTWRFAENQWDYVGEDNRNISSTYNGWIDLFGWGTSGWNSGAVAYQPWSASTSRSDYYPGGSYENNLTGSYANADCADWGVYNQIGDDDPGTWRRLTKNEWYYLINTRTNASGKYGAAKVNGMTGVVILPDVFTLPVGCGFTAGMTSASNWYDWSYVNTTNIYTSAQWQLMEAAGAVFLPASGYRYGTSVDRTGTYGYYWSSSTAYSSYASALYFYSSLMHTGDYDYRYLGRAVRLVRGVSDLDGTPDTYTVTFVNYDGSELQSNTVEAGTIPEYNGATPTKPADAQYTYTFTGWTPEITAVTGDAVYTAVFDPVIVCGTIETTDGTTVWEDDLPYTWKDKTFTEAGTQTTTLKSINGCDSIVTFTLRVRQQNIVLKENESSEYYDLFAQDYNGYTVTTATLNRQFTQGKWATLCLPFNVSKGMMMALGLNARVYEFRYAETVDALTVIYFAAAQSIEAGKGYIVNANAKLAQKTSFVFPNVTINTGADNEDITALTGYNDNSGRGSIYLVGTLRTGKLIGTTNGNIYLGLKDNKLYYPNTVTGTSIRAYRGFFRSETPLNVQRIRIIADGEDKGELIIENEELRMDDSTAVKYISNGILYIERNGRTYNAQGQIIIEN